MLCTAFITVATQLVLSIIVTGPDPPPIKVGRLTTHPGTRLRVQRRISSVAHIKHGDATDLFCL
jgi:hypothetical protein